MSISRRSLLGSIAASLMLPLPSLIPGSRISETTAAESVRYFGWDFHGRQDRKMLVAVSPQPSRAIFVGEGWPQADERIQRCDGFTHRNPHGLHGPQGSTLIYHDPSGQCVHDCSDGVLVGVIWPS